MTNRLFIFMPSFPSSYPRVGLVQVYGIRGGFLRVINKFTAKRTLLKGHVQHLSDISFQNTDSNVLASVDKGGSLIVWEIIDGDGAVVWSPSIVVSLCIPNLARPACRSPPLPFNVVLAFSRNHFRRFAHLMILDSH